MTSKLSVIAFLGFSIAASFTILSPANAATYDFSLTGVDLSNNSVAVDGSFKINTIEGPFEVLADQVVYKIQYLQITTVGLPKFTPDLNRQGYTQSNYGDELGVGGVDLVSDFHIYFPASQDLNVLKIQTGPVSALRHGSDNGFGFLNCTLTAAPVPEPAAWALMAIGFGGIGLARRARRFRFALTA